MSFDLYENENLDAVSSMPPVQDVPAGFFGGMEYIPNLAMRSAAVAGRATSLLASAPLVLLDRIKGDTSLEDRYFKQHEDVYQRAVDYWTPKPNEVGTAAQLVGDMLFTLPTAIAAPPIALGSAYAGTAEDLVRQGVDPTQAQAVGGVQSAGLALGLWMPILGKNLWQRTVVGGAGFNALQGIATRGASQAILSDTEAKDQFHAFDGEALTLDVLMGLGFGTFAHLSPEQRAQGEATWNKVAEWAQQMSPSQKAAIATLREAQHLNVDSVPGKPVDPVDVEAHVNRMRQAIDQLVNDQPVQVSDLPEPKLEADLAREAQTQENYRNLADAAEQVRQDEGIPQVSEVGKTITERLMDIGVPPQEAADKGLLWDSFFKSMSDKTGQDAQQLFGKYFDRVFSSEQAQGDVLMQQQEYKGTPNTEYVPDANFISEAKAHFGVTRDPREAGYILPDGTMLDFTGRHYSSDHPSLRGQRAVDHRELTGENSQGHSLDDLFSQDSGSGNNYMHEFMARTGAMRVDFNAKVASTMRAPTPEQLLVLGQNLKGDWSAVSYIDPVNGRIVGDSEFERTTPATISKFFAEHAGKDAPPNAALFQSATPQPTFYSQLSRAVADAPEKVFGTAAQFKQWLNSNAGKLGVKKDELQWTGITDWLDAQGKNKVSKADIAAYLDQGGVKVEEVTLGKAAESATISRLEKRYSYDTLAAASNGEQGDMSAADFAAWQSATKAVRENKPAKFETYQLPGGENYRELLLTLPALPTDKPVIELRKNAKGKWAWFDGMDQVSGAFVDKADAEAAKATINSLAVKPPATFRSSHFDQPNILAHVRFNERTDAEGRRVLFLEELQSDWGQKGKKEGFAATDAERKEAEALMRKADAAGGMKNLSAEDQARGKELGAALTRSSIPTAPFVTDTKAWTALALKRMIRYAADNGFDAIAWTTGEQQSARYDLSKHLDELAWDKDSGRLVGYKNGDDVMNQTGVTESNLADYIGKDAAEKLIASKPERFDENTELRRISGLDLKVGGEGMKGYYDGIVPQVARDVMKKLGGGEVDSIDIPLPAIDQVGRINLDYEPENSTQPAIILTDAMKAKAQEGMPLFQGNRGFLEFKGSKMGIGLLASADKSTFLHESGHFFLEVMNDLSKEAAPLRADIDALHQWMGVQGDTPEARAQSWDAMSLDEKRPMHEQFARGFEQYLMEGKAPNSRLAEAFARFRDWLIEIYKSATALNVQITDEVRAVMDRMLDSKAKAPQSPPGGDVPPPRVMAGEATAAGLDKVLAAGEPNLENHKPLSDPDVQGMLQDMAMNEAGWAEKGGYLLRSGSEVAGEEVISRTKWIPKAEWWADRPAQGKRRLNEEQVQEAVRKAIAGEPLKPLEQSTVDYMAAIANDRIQGVDQVGPNGWDDAMQYVNRFNEPPTTENVFDYLTMQRAIEINPEAANAAMEAYNLHDDDAIVMAEFRSIINEKIQQDSQSVSGGAGKVGGEAKSESSGQPDPIEAEARRIADTDPNRTISLGTDANGDPVKMTVAEYLDAAKMEADQARKDVSLIQAAAECLMGNL